MSDHPIQYRQAMRTGGRRSRLPCLPKYLLRCLPSWRASGFLNSLLSRDSRRRKVYPEHQAGSGRARASEGKKSMTTIVDRSIPNSQCCPEEGKEGADLLCGEGAIDPRQRPRGINTTDIWEQTLLLPLATSLLLSFSHKRRSDGEVAMTNSTK